MTCFVFRNNTVERFFPQGYVFSGYDDISVIPNDVDGYVWFYQLPVKMSEAILCEEVHGFSERVSLVLNRVSSSKPFYLFTMDEVFFVPMTSGIAMKEAVADYNNALFEAQRNHINVHVIDICEFTRQFPNQELTDWKYWFISQMGMNPRLSNSFLGWYEKKLSQIALQRKKCIVLDLDNTLWGGILGEDGIEGIKNSGDYPGKAFHLFQEALKELSKTGVILTICSKNNEEDVMAVLDNNSNMVLAKEDFSSWRINWNDKASNIKEISNELNIGLDSMVFLDDNPSERELIRQTLPMVAVPDFPTQPYELPLFCRALIEQYFRVYSVTQEDKNKAAQYRSNALRAQSQRTFTDMDSFLESLNMQIQIIKANEFNIPRIAQMTQKTNQFNLTTKRYSESDVRTRIESGWDIFCIRVSDKFGDNGISGCIIVNGNVIDSFLLSCRILGKGIESAFLNTILQLLKDDGKTSISAEYIPTLKNAQVADFYDKSGFSVVSQDKDGKKSYRIDLLAANLCIKPYYSILP